MVIPSALRVTRLAPNRKWFYLGRLSHEVGWKYQGVISRLEEKRRERGGVYYERKKRDLRLRARAARNVAAQPDKHKNGAKKASPAEPSVKDALATIASFSA